MGLKCESVNECELYPSSLCTGALKKSSLFSTEAQK